ncbi:MAG: hypothetical protein WBL63_25800 [Candidatus Acidiferrum sp.]
MRNLRWFFLLVIALSAANMAFAQSRVSSFNCEDPYSLCTERQYNRSYDPDYLGRYIGHDEPSLLFYSNEPGSGNYTVYKMVLPTDPAKFPTDANLQGTGGPTVWNFQLHPAFWFGMALCDSESNPLSTHRCRPDTDDNIFDDPNPRSERYIGRHPGTAFLELQFYPPSWVSGYTPNQYAAALHINSYSVKALGPKGPVANNVDCQNKVGLETTVFALLTLDGKSQAPADPLSTDPLKQAVIPGETFLMNPGDTLIVTIRDTEDGLRTTVEDLTTGQTGFMTASTDNGFAQIVFAPNAPTCTSRPHAYHPMYATSSEHTRVPWAAHSYNVAFSDEIGHFNYCDAQDNSIIPGLGACLASPVESETDPKTGKHNEADDLFCVDTASSLVFGSPFPLGGCLDSDIDFDGVPYHNAWPGTGPDPYKFSAVPTPIRFTSPKFRASEDGEDGLRSYQRVAFEADIPAIEDSSVCDALTGKGCVNPPPGALFYPIYSTTQIAGQCWWQLGGGAISGTTNNFGGSSATEYSTLLGSSYISGTIGHPGSVVAFENYHQVLPHNVCQ